MARQPVRPTGLATRRTTTTRTVHRRGRPTAQATRRTTTMQTVRRLEGPLRLVTQPTTTMPMVRRPDRLLLWAGSDNGGVWSCQTNSGTIYRVRFDGLYRIDT